METVRTSLDHRRIPTLLAALVVLMSVLVVGLGAGALFAWREYARLRNASQAVVGDQGVAARLADMSTRQQRASARLSAMQKDAAKQIDGFEKRAAGIRGKGGGPIDSAAKALEVAALMMDQSLFALKQTAALQDAIVKATLPIGDAADDAVEGDPDTSDVHVPRSARRPPPAVPTAERRSE